MTTQPKQLLYIFDLPGQFRKISRTKLHFLDVSEFSTLFFETPVFCKLLFKISCQVILLCFGVWGVVLNQQLKSSIQSLTSKLQEKRIYQEKPDLGVLCQMLIKNNLALKTGTKTKKLINVDFDFLNFHYSLEKFCPSVTKSCF